MVTEWFIRMDLSWSKRTLHCSQLFQIDQIMLVASCGMKVSTSIWSVSGIWILRWTSSSPGSIKLTNRLAGSAVSKCLVVRFVQVLHRPLGLRLLQKRTHQVSICFLATFLIAMSQIVHLKRNHTQNSWHSWVVSTTISSWTWNGSFLLRPVRCLKTRSAGKAVQLRTAWHQEWMTILGRLFSRLKKLI